MTVSDAPPKAGPREWAGLAVLSLATLLVSIDLFVLLLALPKLTDALHASGVQQLWITDIYGFLVGGLLITMGNLGDKIGRRKLLMLGAAGFGVASLLAAFSTSPAMLIGARALLGVAGATLGPSTLSLISSLFRDPKEMGKAIGIWAATFSAGAIIGPIIGGLLLAHFWWGSVFLLAVPVMVILLVAAPILLPEVRNPDAGPIDPVSVVLSLLAILPFIYGIKEVARTGWTVVPIVTVVVGILFGYLFIRRQKSLSAPLVDLGLFRSRTYSLGLLCLLLFSMLGGATLLFGTQFYQSVGGLSSFDAGLALIPGMFTATVSVVVSPMLAQRIRPGLLMSSALLLSIAGMIVFAQATTLTSILGFALISMGGGPLLAVGMNLIIGSAPPEKMGAAAALPQISNEMGSALGVATLGAVGVAVYHSHLASSIPAGVPASAAAQASENVASAVGVAGTLPNPQGALLASVARDAFTSGLSTVAVIGAIVFAVIAVVVYTLLGKVPPLGSMPGPQAGAPEAGQDGSAAEQADVAVATEQ